MKNFLLALVIVIVSAAATTAQTADVISGETIKAGHMKLYLANDSVRARYNNDPFDNIAVTKLAGDMPVVSGEILNPGASSCDNLLVRTVTVKELLPSENNGKPIFKGAFQYYGFSLPDLIKDFVISKNNSDEFGLTTDLFVIVENKKGDRAVFSWGELFFSAKGHDIIIATAVQPVFPSHDDDRWEVPIASKVVAANDFLTVRNIDKPISITIKSFPGTFPGEKGFRPLYSPDIEITGEGLAFSIKDQEALGNFTAFHNTTFFGMHKGIKGERSFTGTPLSAVLNEIGCFNTSSLKNGIIAFGAKDGYRALFSVSEILNRTDMAEVLLIDAGEDENGRFIIRPGSDFFADRHLKGASRGYIMFLDKD